MKKTLILLSQAILFLIPIGLFAQDNGKLLTRSQTISLEPNLDKTTDFTFGATGQILYKVLLFDEVPSSAAREGMQSLGIEFLEYLPQKSYIAKIPNGTKLANLKSSGVIGLYDVPKDLKLDYRLQEWDIPSHAQDGDQANVALISMKGTNIKDFAVELANRNIAAYKYGSDTRFGYFSLTKIQMESLTSLPWLRYIEIVDEPGIPESTEGRSIQKSNVINNDLSNGISFNADGVQLLVRDDGLVGPHIDYEGRLTNLTTDATGNHGDGVAGVMGGAGNIDPRMEGGASGADIYVINYVSNFQDNTLSLHQNNGVKITNSSYSNGCNAGYTSTTQTVDQQVHQNQTLMHVFSAGNSNNNDCGYGAGNQWGNITGGHKVGKNVMAVANLYEDGALVGSSSRGPAHDGRIKPDISAHGQGQMSTNSNNTYMSFGGTSAAAPSMAGNMAQLIEAYRSLNSNNDPKSSLLKAAVMNSATEMGNIGPDFKYGYGLINTARAYDIIAGNQYLFATVSNGNNNTHSITVPANVGQLRIMLYWHDIEGSVNTNVALVNDLDLTVNGTLLPLVLDHTPNATTLNNPAVPGTDHLNNVEQVVVNNPSAGSYTVNVDGFQVPFGPQEYVIVYSFIQDEIDVTFPLGGESFIPGETELIHWDAFGDSGSFNIEFSSDNGSSWSSLGTANGDERNFSWNVPSTNTGQGLIRVSRLGQSDQSIETFNIFPVPQISLQTQSATELEITWPAISGATKYYIYRLGNKYMDLIDSTTNTQYLLGGLNSGDELWLSVSANSAAIKGERANAEYNLFAPGSSCTGCLYSSTNFPDAESFENGFGGYCNFSNDDIDFLNISGGTPSSNTGPSSASDGSSYVYLEATNPNFPSKVAILGSSCYDLSTATSSSLKFDYHMYGAAMGSLEIEVSTDGGQTWSNPIWSISGNQGNQWNTDSIDFSSYQSNMLSYRFVATSGTSFTSDIALDNILFDSDASSLQVIGESGRVNVNHNNITVNFQNSYVNPIVVAGPPTRDGSHPTTVRISNVTSTGFDIRLDEYEYLNEVHYFERIGYMVLEEGEFLTQDSTEIASGTITANSNFATHNMGTTFSSQPALVASAVTINDPDAVVVRVQNINTSQFDLRLNEEEAVFSHGNEEVHWIGMEQNVGNAGLDYESGVTPVSYRHVKNLLPLSQAYTTNGALICMMNSFKGWNTCSFRMRENNPTTGDVSLILEEEKSNDNEVSHYYENVGYIMFFQTGNILGYPLTNSVNSRPEIAQQEKEDVIQDNRLEAQFDISVFPNPTNGAFSLELSGLDMAEESAILSIYSVDGKIVSKHELKSSLNQIEIEAQPGIYMLSVQHGASTVNKRIQLLN